MLVHSADAAILVALVQVADTLPDALFELVGGVLPDIFDRRRLLLVVQVGFGAVAVALAVLTALGQMTPPLLLVFTFVLGSVTCLPTPRISPSSRTSFRSGSYDRRGPRIDRHQSLLWSLVRLSPDWA